MILIIVESPTKAKKIQQYLAKCTSEPVQVIGSAGHIRDLPKKELGIDIENNFKPTYQLMSKKASLISKLKESAKKASTVLLATDEDREGEAIAYHLIKALKLPKDTKRMVFHEITPKAIKHAFENPRDLDINLVHAQEGRRVLDRLVGFKVSPVLSKKIGEMGSSAGRVQSVVLSEVIKRNQELNNFMEVLSENKKYVITGKFANIGNMNYQNSDKLELKKASECEELLKKFASTKWVINEIKKYESEGFPPKPFTTSTLQQDANYRLKLSTDIVMKCAQNLYQNGLITYHRTDSTELSDDFKFKARDVIIQKYGKEYSQIRSTGGGKKSKGAQEAHEAIRPTNPQVMLVNDQPRNEQKVYELIYKRAMATQMSNARYENLDITVAESGATEHFFKSCNKEMIFDGFTKLYSIKDPNSENSNKKDKKDKKDDKKDKIKLEEKQKIKAKNFIITEQFKQPPQQFQEGTMVKHLEKIGVGRPSTYSSMISLNLKKNYLQIGNIDGIKKELNKYEIKVKTPDDIITKKINQTVGNQKYVMIPTELGIKIYEYLSKNFDFMLDTTYTAKLEKKLDRVAKAKCEWQKVVGGMYEQLDTNLNKAKKDPDIKSVDSVQLGDYVAQKGKFGWYIKTDDWTFSFPKDTNNTKLEENSKILGKALPFSFKLSLSDDDDENVYLTHGKYGYYWKSNKGKNYKNPVIIKKLDDLVFFAKNQANTDQEEFIKLIKLNGAVRVFNNIPIYPGKYGYYGKKDDTIIKFKKKLTDKQVRTLSDEELQNLVKT
jgi:DNA topoisomerase-1